MQPFADVFGLYMYSLFFHDLTIHGSDVSYTTLELAPLNIRANPRGTHGPKSDDRLINKHLDTALHCVNDPPVQMDIGSDVEDIDC